MDTMDDDDVNGEFVGATVAGSLCLAFYLTTSMSTHNDSLLLGAAILLLIEAGIAAAVIASNTVKRFKAPLFRCHELIALAFASPVQGEVENKALYAAALMSLYIFVLTNTFTTAKIANTAREGTMALSRGLAFTSSVLVLVDIYRGQGYIVWLTQWDQATHAALAFLLFFDFLQGIKRPSDAYGALINVVAMTTMSKIGLTNAPLWVDDTSTALHLAAYVCLVFAVAAANYSDSETSSIVK